MLVLLLWQDCKELSCQGCILHNVCASLLVYLWLLAWYFAALVLISTACIVSYTSRFLFSHQYLFIDATISMMEKLCTGSPSQVQVVRDYQIVGIDYYMLGNSFADNYMCSSTCPCIAYSNLDPAKWGNNSLTLKTNYVYNGNYSSFYSCYVNLQS